MKKILFYIFFTSLLSTACIDEYKYEEQPDKDYIGFNTKSEPLVEYKKGDSNKQSTATKGSPIIDVTSMQDMGVFCYYTASTAWATAKATATPNRMNNMQWTQNSGKWSTATPVLWDAVDGANDNYSFFSYAPMANANNGLTVMNTTGVPTIKYTTPTDVVNQPDLTIATAIDQRSVNGRVNLLHKHALAAIAIKVYGKGEQISNVRMKFISTSGTLSLDNTNGISWTGLNEASLNTVEYNLGLTETSYTSTTTPTNITNANGYLMMIPQILDESSILILTIDGNDIAFSLSNQDIKKWEAGQLITYTINTFAETKSISYTTSELSNCYIINPSSTENQIIRIPVKKAFYSPACYGEQDWKVGVIAQTSASLFNNLYGIRFTGAGARSSGLYSEGSGYEDSYFELYVPRGAKGGHFIVNLGVNATEAPSSKDVNYHTQLYGQPYYWSWTFWVTSYNPYGTRTPIEYNDDGSVWAWSVPGGKLFNVGGKVTMDRDLLSTSEGGIGGVFAYGRKDPSPRMSPTRYDNMGNRISYSSYTFQRTIVESINENITFPAVTFANSQTGDLSWEITGEASGNSTLWDYSYQNKKTFYDPSPVGFRVAPSSIFYTLGGYPKSTVNSLKWYSPKATMIQKIALNALGARNLGTTFLATGYGKTINYWADTPYIYKENLDGTTATTPPTDGSMYLCPVRCIALP